ncbi:leucine--tRNA ligase [bacterium F11]|nr:leucine--tRNA ligase [bacterium F11]
MASTFPFKEIEKKWQKVWLEKGVDQTPVPANGQEPYYILVMFPYPSGDLHMGHVRNYTIGDILARYHRKKGRAVMHPIGWDAFGLPAENAAIQRKTHPSKWTLSNIENMRGQLKSLAISYDWDKEFATCNTNYYRWNQWIFIKMFEKGLAYRRKAPVNWCPEDKTVLANEQVHDGKCWRCDSTVIQKELDQWFFKITEYSQELLDGHDQLKPDKGKHGWPEQVLTMQKNWIGRSQGAYVDFDCGEDKIRVFTTRPDTLFGATFMVLSPEHPLVSKITNPQQQEDINRYREKAKRLTKSDRTSELREKTGEFTGAYAINPVNGEKIPIWIADYVLTDYGTGAIMAVPAHDQRDFDFAKKYNIPIVQVIEPTNIKLKDPLEKAFEEEGVLINSGEFNGIPTAESKEKIAESLKSKGKGESTITYKLRDWLLSRQRYWGTPIPMVHCKNCDVVPVNEKDLPIELPEDVELTGGGDSPLSKVASWLNVPCPKCGSPSKRETDTMDTFVDSSWYYARYINPQCTTVPVDKKESDPWLPVHQYVGGIEHACMHLIYSRFFHKVLRDFGLLSSDEPFGSLLTQGMVTLGGSAMSKSKGNTVDPTDVISKYGADACRLFIMFAAPPTQQLEWSDSQVEGIWRFINRIWRLAQMFSEGDQARTPKRSLEEKGQKVNRDDLVQKTNETIKKVTEDIEKDFGFNTAIAAIMELVNTIYLYPDLRDQVSREAIETVLQLVSPFAPHLSEELWQQMGKGDLIVTSEWPSYDPKKIVSKSMQIVIQINGKLRDKIEVEANAQKDTVTTLALQTLQNKGQKIAPKRIIYVPHKLVNFVVPN